MEIEKNSLPIEIATYIMKKILSGELQQGTRLIEADFAQQFNVSSIPVREAFYILQSSGLIEKIPRKGVRVKQNTDKEINDYITALMDLFRIALKYSKDKWTDESFKVLKTYLDETTESLNQKDVVEYLAKLTILLSYLFKIADNNAFTRFFYEVSNVTTAYCQSIWKDFDKVEDWHRKYVVNAINSIIKRDFVNAEKYLELVNRNASNI
ncbi:GntR family transcriptional regulator [Saccharococcus sp. Marseille-Q5394]|uniref:GntR family transcriptional regulator n=1 Tax=Saccharococcus sp. Marseille-Q5394 TaxID=2972778 RepID=UPI0021C5C9CD|nr:GntR family transcriptional regulator [Saccharococcus sp. Marseille-Q5394]